MPAGESYLLISMMASPGLEEALDCTHGYEPRDNTMISALVVMMEEDLC